MNVQQSMPTQALRRWRIIPVIVIDDAKNALPLASALLDGGLPIAEITLRTSTALDSLRRITQEQPEMFGDRSCARIGNNSDEGVADRSARWNRVPQFSRGTIRRSRVQSERRNHRREFRELPRAQERGRRWRLVARAARLDLSATIRAHSRRGSRYRNEGQRARRVTKTAVRANYGNARRKCPTLSSNFVPVQFRNCKLKTTGLGLWALRLGATGCFEWRDGLARSPQPVRP